MSRPGKCKSGSLSCVCRHVCSLAIKTHQCTVLDAALGSEKIWTFSFFFNTGLLETLGYCLLDQCVFFLENWGYTLGFSGRVKERGSTSGELGALGSTADAWPISAFGCYSRCAKGCFFVQVSCCTGNVSSYVPRQAMIRISTWMAPARLGVGGKVPGRLLPKWHSSESPARYLFGIAGLNPRRE